MLHPMTIEFPVNVEKQAEDDSVNFMQLSKHKNANFKISSKQPINNTRQPSSNSTMQASSNNTRQPINNTRQPSSTAQGSQSTTQCSQITARGSNQQHKAAK